MLRTVAMLFAGAALLSACSMGQERPVSQAPPGISYRVQDGDLAQTNLRADQYCEQYGKRARLQGVKGNAPDSIANYECL